MRGRKPKLDGEKLGHHKHEPPVPAPPGSPECPEHLKGEAKREWGRLCRELDALGRLSICDRGAMAAAAMQWATHIRAEKSAAAGAVVKNGKLNPAIRASRDALALYLRYLAELGLTPVSRQRAKVVNSTPENPFEDFLRRAQATN